MLANRDDGRNGEPEIVLHLPTRRGDGNNPKS